MEESTAGDLWECPRCQTRNSNPKADSCSECHLKNQHQKKVSTSNDPEKDFDKMFQNWESQFESWKEENKDNPDQDYVRRHIENMNTMRSKMLERLENLRKDIAHCFNNVAHTNRLHVPKIEMQ